MSTENIVDKLSEITGFKKPEIDSILNEVKANIKLLDGCPGPHDFSICIDRRTKQPVATPTPHQRFGAKWKCTRCGGIVDHQAKLWYERGLAHTKSENQSHPQD